ncbi:MAG: outer membrane protein assembly factor BamD [candidate division NC10 bacterium]|nr:outer membrane protein assembly factor BamD [candidate division NC10 bacterium]
MPVVSLAPSSSTSKTSRPILLRRLTRGWLLLMMLSLLLQGCGVYEYFYGRPPQRESQRSDQDLLRSAEVSVQRRRYEDARKDLQRLMNQYPESDLLAAARLASAKALYLGKKYDEARAEYQRFLDLHPQHERADEAHYYLGLSYFRQADSPDRDQTFTRKALEEFDLLLGQMPDSQYAADARERRTLARHKLAEKELYVGTFYFTRGNYAAAVGRFNNLLAQYGGAGFDDQALYLLGESLWQLEQKDEARAAFQRVVQSYSQSEWAGAAAARLGVTLVRTGPPTPKGPGAADRLWQGLKETWDELADTVKDYQIFR